MDPMSKFTGRLSFTISYRLCDALRAIHRIGEGQNGWPAMTMAMQLKRARL
jgi:hypothetical protein